MMKIVETPDGTVKVIELDPTKHHILIMDGADPFAQHVRLEDGAIILRSGPVTIIETDDAGSIQVNA